MKRALVLGSTGQDGSYLCEYLVSLGYSVTGMVRRNPVGVEWLQSMLGKMDFVYGDIRNSLDLNAAVRKAWPDEIYNLTGQTFSPLSWAEPYETLQVNAGGLAILLQVVEQLKSDAKVFQPSACEMFGDKTGLVNEEVAFAPITPYGVSKLAAHHLVDVYRRKGLWVCAGILANHESPRRGSEMLTRKVARAVAGWTVHKSPRTKLALGNLLARRDWNFAGDVVKAMHSMLQRETPKDYVIGSGEVHTVEDVLVSALASVGSDLNWDLITLDERFVRKGETNSCYIADASEARKDGVWNPETSFDDLMGIMVRAEIERMTKCVEC